MATFRGKVTVGKNMFHTIAVQYRQKRRGAWGVETFADLGSNLLKNKHIPLKVKFSKLFQILDNHINWATWSIINSFVTPALLFWARLAKQDALILFNISYINSTLFSALNVILLLSIFISMEFLPPRPKEVSALRYVSFVFQWLLLPVISAILGSAPAVDAQTRLLLGRGLDFYATPKNRN
ncbi:hypothetical protein KJ577_04695 [bacterium]|nr:hypothetical protein [bacterium]